MSKRTPTQQQLSCIAAAVDEAIGLVKVEACAGSGKTSTLVMMAEANAVPSMYLAFNKVTAEEGTAKFPKHVECRTTHSVAYQHFGARMQRAGKLSRPTGRYVNVAGTGSEIARFFSIRPLWVNGEVVLSDAFLGLLTKITVQRFEQSADAELNLKHTPYGELMEKFNATPFDVKSVQAMLLSYAQKLWAARIDLNSEVLASHDTYLKMFQLSKPVLAGIKVLYVDEFQDTTPCVLDIVMNQARHGIKVVMVGDARQAIYAWRGAVNAMQLVQAPTRALTKSFRYGQAVADIATTVLQGAMQIGGNENIKSVVGFDNVVDRTQPYTRLFRTNAALLGAAVQEVEAGTEVSIEIDVKDFVKLLQSSIALFNGDKKNAKHDKVLPYNEWAELVEEGKHDSELSRVAKMVSEGFAEHAVAVLERHKNSKTPHVTFTTAHKSKGREWLQVIVESDFKSCLNEEGEFVGLVEDEQNLLYVACTRAINVLEYNRTVLEYIREEAGIRQEFNKVVGKKVRRLKKDVQAAIAA